MIFMRVVFIVLALIGFACKSIQNNDHGMESSASNPKQLPEKTNYANHPSNDLDVQTFLKNFRQQSKTEAMLIDLRTPPEFDDGYIPGAILINFLESDIDQQLSLLDKNKTYFIYCLQGARSSKCLDKMHTKGFTKVFNLIGGYEAYQLSGIK